MNPEKDEKKKQDAMLQQEIRSSRKFSMAEAIGREGGHFMKGHNPVPAIDQLVAKLNDFIRDHTPDASRILISVLQERVKNNSLALSEQSEKPFGFLHGLIRSCLDHPERLYELTRQADIRWGQINKEKPYFQKPGEPPHPDDEYSHESVAARLRDLLEAIETRMDGEDDG
ncbi:hypothetical protein LZ24_01124 [Desulfobotulus alkaliphilus]|uniref:Uncharacterized protein n=1 Tax=Desulfobotulus alkaliphilus TaxID=622671 RepID=A0A562S042_9BACT|nr:hypothetical protein [Desulfobotulus alkaliphilus]TWI74184.1 hypothetical protein LZ24_01124 [Desulfobotulus alkaliphilus]